MSNFETDTVELIKSLPIDRKTLDDLITAIEWEKELSWSDGYATAVDQLDNNQ
jgi:hypothetical protein